MSSTVKSMPTSRAMAIRCSTALVEPPEAATAAVAFSKARRVRISEGRRSASSTRIASRPISSEAGRLAGSMAGMELKPTGEMPRSSSTIDIVLAVYWPPQAPAPGQATASSSRRSASLMRPAETAPMASYMSPTATCRPRKEPA